MLRETLTIIVFCTLMLTPFPPSISAQSKNEAKIKQKIAKLGINKNVRIELKDEEIVDGRISEIRESEVAIQPAKNPKAMSRDIRYEDIRRVGARTHTARYIAIGFGAALLILNIAYRV